MNPYNQHYRTRKKRRVNKKRFLPFLIAVIILGGAATVSLAAAIRNISGAVTANGDAVQSAAAVLDQQPEETPMPPEAAPTPVATPTPAPTPAPTNLVDYTGPIEHVFVHPLVVYPELAFDGDAQSKGMDDYMTTVDEFRTMLE